MVLLLLTIVLIRLPSVQNYLSQKVVNYVEGEINSEVRLKNIYIGFPKSIVLEGLYVEDRQQDTLVDLNYLEVDLDMWELIHSNIDINYITVDGLNSNIYTQDDRQYNFQFIIDAFAGNGEDTAAKEQKTSGSTTFQLDKVSLSNITFDLNDKVIGIELHLDLGELNSEFRDLDPLSNTYLADFIEISHTDLSVHQFRGQTTEDDTASTMPDFSIGAQDIRFQNFNADYSSAISQQNITAELGLLHIVPKEFSLKEQLLRLQEIELNNSHIAYIQGDTGSGQEADNVGQEVKTEETESGWKVTLERFNAEGNVAIYHDENVKRQEEGLDYAHMEWEQLNFQIRDVLFNYPELDANIVSLKGRDHSGFTVQQLSTVTQMDALSIDVSSFIFKSPNSSVSLDGKLQFASLTSIAENIGELKIDANVRRSRIGVRDVLFFQPTLSDQPPFQKNKQGSFRIQGTVNGSVNDLSIPSFQLGYGQNTRLQLKGQISGLPGIDTTYFDIESPSLQASREELLKLIPPNSIPETIELPPRFSGTATFTGTLGDFNTSLDLNSPYGQMTASAEMKMPAEGTASYTAEVRATHFNLGALLRDTVGFGRLSMQVDASGESLEWQNLSADIEARADSFNYNQYTYHNIDLSSRIKNRVIRLDGQIRDSNIIMDLSGQADLSTTPYAFNALIDLKGSALNKLGFTEKNIRAKGKLDLELLGIDPDSLRATVYAKDMLVIQDQEEYYVDSVYTFVNTMDSISRLDLYSGFIEGHVEGNVDPLKFASVFEDHIQYYLAEEDAIDSLELEGATQQFDFNFTVKRSRFLTDLLLPSLNEIEAGSISGSYNSNKHNMTVQADFPRIVYSGITVDSLQLSVNSGTESMQFAIRSSQIENPAILIPNLDINGQVQNRNLDLSLEIAEDTAYQNIYLAGRMNMVEQAYRFRFDQDGFVLDNEQWQVPEGHFIQFGGEQIKAQDLRIQKGQREISVQKIDKNTLEIAFEKFSLEELFQAFQKEQNLVSGILNGNFSIKRRPDQPLYNADLSIKEFQFMQSSLGTVSLQAENPQIGVYDLKATVTGADNDAVIQGNYDTKGETAQIDLSVMIERLNLKSLEAFTLGQIENTAGYLSGNMEIKGEISDPLISGNLTFNEAVIGVTRLNTRYQIKGQTINFNRRQIQLNNFTILDTLGNEAAFNGRIDMQELSNPSFNIDGSTNNFYLLDKKEEKNALFYGTLILNSEFQLRGTLSRPKISASATIKEGSDVAFVIPADDPRLETGGGIDEFIDRDRELHTIMEIDGKTDTISSGITGMDLRATVKTDRKSKLRIYLDEGKGNFLQVRGDADLIFGIDPSGQMTLTGRYQVYDGKYQLLFRNVVKRTFQLQEGSSITWTGNIMEANVDLTAIHTKEAEPLGLVQDQISGDDQAAFDKYKQTYPFQVLLNMQEELTSPMIDFDITLPNEYQGALGGELQARLNRLNQNESELNKQVFALLVLGRFIPEDPFNVSGGGTTEGTARRGVSSLLNAQLDKFSDKYIDAFELDLSLDSYEDYSTGEREGRTELNIGLQKALFNERLTVRVGGNIDLEGSQSRNQQASDLIGDLSVEYALTEEGTWKLRAFRKNEYEGIIDGDIIKTGASLIFSRDYDQFSDLFKKNKKN